MPALDPSDLATDVVVAPERLRDLAVERSIGKARARAEQRTTALIDAALDLIAERGSLEFTVQEVVERAQLSLHAFYLLFEGKDALIDAVLEESLERGVVVLREIVDAEDHPVARLRAFVVGYHELATASGPPLLGTGHAFRHLVLQHSDVGPSKSWKTFRPLRLLAYELLRAADDERGVRTDLEIDLLAGFVLSSMLTLTRLTIDEPEQRWPDGEQLWELIAQGVVRSTRAATADGPEAA